MPSDSVHWMLVGADACVALLYVFLFVFSKGGWSPTEQFFMIALPLSAAAALALRIVPIPDHRVPSYFLTQMIGVGIPIILYSRKARTLF